MKIHFHGALAAEFPQYNGLDFQVDTPAQAINLLMAQAPKLKRRIRPMQLQLYRGRIEDERELLLERIHWKSSAEEIHIAPAVAGSGRTAMIIIGTILVIAAAVALTIMTGGLAAPLIPGIISVGQALVLGTALVIGGLVMPASTDPEAHEAEEARSALYNGGVNRVAEGTPIALVLGDHVRWGGQVIATGVDIVQMLSVPPGSDSVTL